MERRRPRHQPAKPLVLFADGHDDTRELYAVALNRYGFKTSTVDGGANPYQQARKIHPDVIVMEVSLPEVDGWDSIRDVKHDPQTRDIPVVILTCDARKLARERAQREGCGAFLVKPCLPEQLASELRDVLRRTRLKITPRRRTDRPTRT
jgi:two-component system, cell cycle response regulator DivK